jgi:cytochrome c553
MKRLALIALAAFATSASTTSAFADGPRARLPVNATYVDECGSCHVAYPPGLLPADSWRRLMGDLPNHYGTDASLDANVRQSLAAWLEANASGKRLEAPPQDRITKSRWFVREHDEVPADAWRRASIKTAANCSACHQGAAQGDYDEHGVRIPR